jgi:hypothetical protein
MRKMKHVVLYCTAILLSVAGFGVCAEEALGTKAVDKPLVILFAPSENTPAFSLTQPFRDGILAAYEEDKDQYELRQMPLDPGSNVEEALAAAADAGAMLVIGPIFKNSVNEVATMSYVPVPVLAINRTQRQEVPKLFMSIDVLGRSDGAACQGGGDKDGGRRSRTALCNLHHRAGLRSGLKPGCAGRAAEAGRGSGRSSYRA